MTSMNSKKNANSPKKVPNAMEKSRKQAYEEPSKEIMDLQNEAKKRLQEAQKKIESSQVVLTPEEVEERRKQEILIGQLKAAEARNRLRIMQLRYQSNREREVKHLISCQNSALEAVRLEAMLPSGSHKKSKTTKSLPKLDKERVEALVEDELQLLTKRNP